MYGPDGVGLGLNMTYTVPDMQNSTRQVQPIPIIPNKTNKNTHTLSNNSHTQNTYSNSPIHAHERSLGEMNYTY